MECSSIPNNNKACVTNRYKSMYIVSKQNMLMFCCYYFMYSYIHAANAGTVQQANMTGIHVATITLSSIINDVIHI